MSLKCLPWKILIHFGTVYWEGGIYKQEILPIEQNDTSETLAEKASKIGAKSLLEGVLAELCQFE